MGCRSERRLEDATAGAEDGPRARRFAQWRVVRAVVGERGEGDAAVAEAVETVSSSDLVVCASPTFKATYTGVLKLFLDQFAGDTGLRGVTVLPLMLGAGPAHAMAPDLFLKHVLVELGATAPAPGLYLIDSSYTTDSKIGDYVSRWGSTLLAAASTRSDLS